jgi:hypothetical protein
MFIGTGAGFFRDGRRSDAPHFRHSSHFSQAAIGKSLPGIAPGRGYRPEAQILKHGLGRL